MSTALRAARADARADGTIPAAGTRLRVATVLELGRAEARHLVTHPTFWLSMVFSTLLLRGLIGAREGAGATLTLAWLIAGIGTGVLFGTLLSTNVAALRNRRDRTEELYGSLPSPPEARTLGLVAGLVLGPVPVAVVTAAAAWVAFASIGDLDGLRDPFFAAQYLLTAFALGTAGLAVGRWVPSLLGGPVVIAAHIWTPIIWVAPWLVTASTDVHMVWHLVYLLVVPVTWIALAFARDRRTPLRLAISAGAFCIGVAAVVLQLPRGGY
jgi:hypothetical protein